MSDTHGTAIICQRVKGDTLTWVDEGLSEAVPPGYFIETWVGNMGHSIETLVVHAGTEAEGYWTDWWYGEQILREWLTPDKALEWCRDHARMREREAV
jgi:hypothetical protein